MTDFSRWNLEAMANEAGEIDPSDEAVADKVQT